MTLTDTEDAWRTLVARSDAAKKYFDIEHPLDLLYGSDLRGRAVLVVITGLKPPVPVVSDDVDVTLGRRELDGKWVLTLTLLDHALMSPFVRLCFDLVDRSRNSRTERSALAALIEALSEWKILLRPSKSSRLSLGELRGLVAELWYAREFVAPFRGWSEIVSSWTGPAGGAQDYVFSDGLLIEVKSCYPGADSVTISSEKQLDALGKTLQLAVVVLDNADELQPSAFNLPSLTSSIRTSLGADMRALFDKLLQTRGVDLTDEHYGRVYFSVQSCQTYSVVDGFPMIVGSELPDGLSNVTYELRRTSIAPFLVRHSNKDEGVDL